MALIICAMASLWLIPEYPPVFRWALVFFLAPLYLLGGAQVRRGVNNEPTAQDVILRLRIWLLCKEQWQTALAAAVVVWAAHEFTPANYGFYGIIGLGVVFMIQVRRVITTNNNLPASKIVGQLEFYDSKDDGLGPVYTIVFKARGRLYAQVTTVRGEITRHRIVRLKGVSWIDVLEGDVGYVYRNGNVRVEWAEGRKPIADLTM